MNEQAIAYEVNVSTGKIVERFRTEEELAVEAAEQAKLAVAQSVFTVEEAAKAEARQAVLDRLGITAEEAALLLA